MTDVEIAYAAGLIDGEGYVGVTRTRTNKAAKGCRRGVSYRTMVTVSMTDMRALKFLQRVAGNGRFTKIKKQKRSHRQAWRWTLWSRQAANFLKLIRPYLVIKAEAADVCIAFQDAMRIGGYLSDEEWAFREECWRRTKELSY